MEKEGTKSSSLDVSCLTDGDTGRSVKLATSGSFVARPNQVTTVMLHGVPIVCLYIDGKERLCLAQISNTLLKKYSYNEIHNRRVALGITCVQCTPVQLEILRRAGAMPISSRRCGMITMREAQRLVKSFLEENSPPKLPENFSFHVKHLCGWGCEGNFEPSRYNSSRAKCIKCTLCNMYFSPNKFIFHFHRTPESKYNHPDAANFNSWRRHLHLASGNDNDGIMHAWEDVKAMFNGGSRKRIMSSAKGSHMEPSLIEPSVSKASRLASPDYDLGEKVYSSPYSALSLLSQPRKHFSFSQIGSPHPLGFGLPFPKEYGTETSKSPGFQNPSWAGLHSMLPAYNLLWNNPFSHDYNPGVRSTVFPIKEPVTHDNFPDDDSSSSAGNSPTYDEKNERFSAFRLVSKSRTPEEKISKNEEKYSEDIDVTEEIDITDEHVKVTQPLERNDNNENLERSESSHVTADDESDIQHTDQTNKDILSETVDKITDEIQKQIKLELEIRKKMEQEIQTLKEAHDALHNFSCKMLASRQCDECSFKDDEDKEVPTLDQ
ncbi:hypothetical protein FSP39_010383 [Pinctada imbricata]|uniref:c-SKI SMAD4-binding domain-containing protein n=1 Tax=Pinctada imbricata TaxID=66713 RepID=A0AA89C333_PINIB|nr:hypothetical protein FSP39_010383 [Pinctada imbricata]